LLKYSDFRQIQKPLRYSLLYNYTNEITKLRHTLQEDVRTGTTFPTIGPYKSETMCLQWGMHRGWRENWASSLEHDRLWMYY